MAMAKTKKTEEPLEGRTDDVDEILKRIEKFNEMSAAMRPATADVKTHPEDIYHLEIKKPDLESRFWKIFHGKCLEKGFKQLKEWGYVYTVVRHTPKDDKPHSRTRCEHCGKVLNEKLAAELHEEWLVRTAKRKADYEKKVRVQKAMEDELVLLGKL